MSHAEPARSRAVRLVHMLLALGAALGAAAIAALAHPAPAHAAQTPPAASLTPPAEFRQIQPWLDYKRQARIPALPAEARIFFRHGLDAYQAAAPEEAVQLVRGAVELDPTFLGARLTLLRWAVTTDASQVLAHASGIVSLVRRDFATQWSLAANAAYLILNAWLVGLIATALLMLVAHNAMIRHAVRERLARFTTPASSHAWAWVLLIAPFVLGWGVALPSLAGLGLLWPLLKARERAVWVLLFVSLIGTPFAMGVFDRVALPMRSESPLAIVLPLGNEAWNPARADDIARAAKDHPQDAYVRYGEGWMALRRGDGPAAEAAYRDVLKAWPGDDHALDNLGTAQLQQGRLKDAIDSYGQSTAANPKNAVAYFNLAQAHLLQYEFDAANKEMARASTLDFDGVSDYKNQPARNGTLDPVPDWLSARRQWEAVRASAPTGSGLPPEWQGRVETSSERFAGIAALVGLLSIGLGLLLNRGLPLHRCVNCDRVVCRRCAERRKAQALCTACARVARGAASADFSRILLARERERSTRIVRGFRLGLALAVPGAGLLSNRRVWRALTMLVFLAGVLTVTPGATWPYAGRARMAMAFDPWCLSTLIPLTLIVLLSLWGHFAEQGKIARRQAEAARLSRSRPRPSTQVHEDGARPKEAA